MRYVERDAAHLRIGRTHDPDLLGSLHEPRRVLVSAQSHESGDTGRHAALTRGESDLAGDDLVIVLLHDLLHPGLEVRVGEIGDPIGWLTALAIGDVRIFWIVGEGARPRAA